ALPGRLEKQEQGWRHFLANHASARILRGARSTMTAIAPASLMAELDDALNDRSPARRVEILREVTSLLVSDVDRLNPAQIDVFDEILVRLIERAEARTLAQLSRNLSGLSHAPRD